MEFLSTSFRDLLFKFPIEMRFSLFLRGRRKKNGSAKFSNLKTGNGQ